MRVSSHIYVLDFGQLLFEGDRTAVAASAAVQAAYLGMRTSGPDTPSVAQQTVTT
jgi:ABC-type lipopolysaccharide export system ATPase subunit